MLIFGTVKDSKAGTWSLFIGINIITDDGGACFRVAFDSIYTFNRKINNKINNPNLCQ